MPAGESVAAFAAHGDDHGRVPVGRPARSSCRPSCWPPGSAYTADTPAAIVVRASWPDEQVVRTTVGRPGRRPGRTGRPDHRARAGRARRSAGAGGAQPPLLPRLRPHVPPPVAARARPPGRPGMTRRPGRPRAAHRMDHRHVRQRGGQGGGHRPGHRHAAGRGRGGPARRPAGDVRRSRPRRRPRCVVVKDAGDDPDCTDGARMTAEVGEAGDRRSLLGRARRRAPSPSRAWAWPWARPAINPVPRRMIPAALAEVTDAPLAVTFSVPGGEDMAAKTSNARLGIVGGISILGTTGIVKPFSTAAYRASVVQQIDVAAAQGEPTVVLATGSRSERAAMRLRPDLPEVCFVEVGDFTGIALRRAAADGIGHVVLVGMVGKITKLAAGVMMTHFHRSQVDGELLAEVARASGVAGRGRGRRHRDGHRPPLLRDVRGPRRRRAAGAGLRRWPGPPARPTPAGRSRPRWSWSTSRATRWWPVPELPDRRCVGDAGGAVPVGRRPGRRRPPAPRRACPAGTWSIGGDLGAGARRHRRRAGPGLRAGLGRPRVLRHRAGAGRAVRARGARRPPGAVVGGAGLRPARPAVGRRRRRLGPRPAAAGRGPPGGGGAQGGGADVARLAARGAGQGAARPRRPPPAGGGVQPPRAAAARRWPTSTWPGWPPAPGTRCRSWSCSTRDAGGGPAGAGVGPARGRSSPTATA